MNVSKNLDPFCFKKYIWVLTSSPIYWVSVLIIFCNNLYFTGKKLDNFLTHQWMYLRIFAPAFAWHSRQLKQLGSDWQKDMQPRRFILLRQCIQTIDTYYRYALDECCSRLVLHWLVLVHVRGPAVLLRNSLCDVLLLLFLKWWWTQR